jgi:hypothetical protein
MNLSDILSINSIPVLENELRSVMDNLFKAETDEDTISLIQKEMLIRVRIKQIEIIINS